MACRTPSVDRAAEKTKDAASAIDKLEKMLKDRAGSKKEEFFAQIDQNFAAAKIDDAVQVEYSMDIKTEYSHEFSLDKVAGVITAVLNAAAEATKASVAPSPPLTPEALEAYTDVVNNVAEAARSSSDTASSMSFSMTRIGRGMFAFLYATSINIHDEETFGTEAVTSTAIFYRLMQSIQDAKNQEKFESAQIYADAVLKAKRLQAALLDELAEGKLTIDEYLAKDAQMQLVVDRNQKRLDEAGWDKTAPLTAPAAGLLGAPAMEGLFGAGATDTESAARDAVDRLSARGDAVASIVAAAREKLETSYFQ
ncbi:MAG: hypothetical protein AAGF30_11315 [Pseudomonadota bacterium]